MTDAPNFYYRFKPDLSFAIICANCSETVAITSDEFYLRDLETKHRCGDKPRADHAA